MHCFSITILIFWRSFPKPLRHYFLLKIKILNNGFFSLFHWNFCDSIESQSKSQQSIEGAKKRIDLKEAEYHALVIMISGTPKGKVFHQKGSLKRK